MIASIASGARVLWIGESSRKFEATLRSEGLEVVSHQTGLVAALPFADAAFDVVAVGSALEQLAAETLSGALRELRRVSRDALIFAVSGEESPGAEVPTAARKRDAWERIFFSAGFRRHPASARLNPLERISQEGAAFLVALQVRPGMGRAAQPGGDVFDATDDVLRVPGLAAEAAGSFYALAASRVRPGDTVLVMGSGAGAGAAMLWDLTEAKWVVGRDSSLERIAYALREYNAGRSRLSFEAAESSSAPIAAVDCLVYPNGGSPSLVTTAARALRPGGRLIWSAEAGSAARELLRECERILLVETVLSCDAGYGGWHPLTLPAGDDFSAAAGERWFVSAMRDPVGAGREPYRETVFPAATPVVPAALAFGRDYRNPWLVHGMLMGPFRLRSRRLLAEMATRTLQEANTGSADEGAALCLLLYRFLEETTEASPARVATIAAAERYADAGANSAHAARWKISLRFVLALLAQREGRMADAERQFRACLAMDFMAFSAHLGTKCSEAGFHAGRLALLRGAFAQAETDWRAVIALPARIPWQNPEALLLNPQRPAAFEVGDGLREVTMVVDNAARCANGLRVLDEMKAGRALPGLDWDRSFQTNQQRMLREIERRGGEIAALRNLVAHREAELAALEFARTQVASELNQARQGWTEECEARHTAEALRHRAEVENAALRVRLDSGPWQTRVATWRGFLRRMNYRTMKNVVIFGAGQGGRRLWEAVSMSARAHVCYFVDNDARKHGLPFLGSEVCAPAALREAGFDLVLVGSIYANEIVAQLSALGVPRERIQQFELSVSDETLAEAVATALPVPELPAAFAGAGVKRVGIFGTGQGGMRVWDAVMGLDRVEPVWFADNDARKHGKPFLWLDIVAPAEIPRRPVDFVIIGSMYREPITKQLIELGVPADRILTPSVTASMDIVSAELAQALQEKN